MRENKIKVLHVLKSSIYSGAENVVITLIRNLGVEFETVYVATEGPIRERLIAENVEYCLMDAFDRKHLHGVIQRYQPDIVHAHDFSATVLCASLKENFRLISHLHYDPPWVTHWNLKTLIFAACNKRIDCLLGVSEAIFQSMIFYPAYRGKAQTVGNPMDFARIRSLAKDVPEEKKIDLLFAGRLVEQKDPLRFILLIHKLKLAGWQDIRSVMLGAGELASECKKLIHQYDLQDNIEMAGFTENPYRYMKQSRLLVMTSRWEGFGLVALEAGAFGIPVLSTPTSGCTDILGEEAPELYGNDDEFIEKVFRLRDDRESYAQWKTRARKRVKSFDNIQTYRDCIQRIYKELMID